jgi:hypothetical protein
MNRGDEYIERITFRRCIFTNSILISCVVLARSMSLAHGTMSSACRVSSAQKQPRLNLPHIFYITSRSFREDPLASSVIRRNLLIVAGKNGDKNYISHETLILHHHTTAPPHPKQKGKPATAVMIQLRLELRTFSVLD